MKYFILFMFVLVSTSGFSKIWRINNSAGVSADFTTAQAAHDAATAGDTLMFEPSAVSYGNITLTKQLVIFGVGYFHSKNYPNSPITTTSTLGTIVFNGASSGSLLSGVMYAGNIDINTADITIKGCRNVSSLEINLNSATNVVIARCWYANIDMVGSSSGVLITNSVISGLDAPGTNSGVVISNNIFAGVSLNCVGHQLSNNILLGAVGCCSYTLTSSTLANNIDARLPAGELFGTGNGNFGNVSPVNIFVAGTVSGNTYSFTYDSDLVLKAASPATGAGGLGADCGIFGGSGPYILSGLPPIPMLTKLVSTGIGSDVTPVQITISAQSNN